MFSVVSKRTYKPRQLKIQGLPSDLGYNLGELNGFFSSIGKSIASVVSKVPIVGKTVAPIIIKPTRVKVADILTGGQYTVGTETLKMAKKVVSSTLSVATGLLTPEQTAQNYMEATQASQLNQDQSQLLQPVAPSFFTQIPTWVWISGAVLLTGLLTGTVAFALRSRRR